MVLRCTIPENSCWTTDLKRMAAWLRTCRVDTVPMQATGVYSIPLYDILTGHGIRVVLVNAQHTKNVTGRKRDVQECQWLMKSHTDGLLGPWQKVSSCFPSPQRIRPAPTNLCTSSGEGQAGTTSSAP